MSALTVAGAGSTLLEPLIAGRAYNHNKNISYRNREDCLSCCNSKTACHGIEVLIS